MDYLDELNGIALYSLCIVWNICLDVFLISFEVRFGLYFGAMPFVNSLSLLKFMFIMFLFCPSFICSFDPELVHYNISFTLSPAHVICTHPGHTLDDSSTHSFSLMYHKFLFSATKYAVTNHPNLHTKAGGVLVLCVGGAVWTLRD